jgi:L-xylulose reductase
MRIESYEAVMAVNLRAAAIFAQAYARDRVSRGIAGSIVNISSLSSSKGFAAHAAYCASKAGLDGMSRVMANELGPHGIRVNCVNPGVTLTELAAEAWSAPEKSAPMLGRTPLGRFAEVGEVAELVAFLLSDRSRMITGTTNLLDGGFSAA